jgi:hypothetical protein
MGSLDDVLEQVARGELTPDEALALLDTGPQPEAVAPAGGATTGPEPAEVAPAPAAESGTDAGAVRLDKAPEPPPYDPVTAGVAGTDPPAADPGADAPPAYEPPDEPVPDAPVAGRGLRTVKVRTLANALEVYADPGVAEVLVTSGSVTLRRDGDTVIVEQDRGRVPDGGRYAFVNHLGRTLASIPGIDQRIVLRVNPAVLVDIDVSAVSVKIWGCEGGLRLRLAASSAKFDRVTGPITIDAQASSIKGSARVTGEGHIRAESSSVKLGLREGSDVRIQYRNSMGKVVLPMGRSRTAGSRARTATVGRGTGRLMIDATMSSVIVGNDQWSNR